MYASVRVSGARVCVRATAALLALMVVWAGMAVGVEGAEERERERGDGDGCTPGLRVRTAAGLVCGVARRTRSGRPFASFLGLPYAQQPLGALRFKELQPLRRWQGVLAATAEGPPCPQTDILYGPLLPATQPASEACIHANVHVPLEALPWEGDHQPRPPRDIQPPLSLGQGEGEGEREGDSTTNSTSSSRSSAGLPILVFVHGGGFAFSSGSPALHGPEHLLKEKLIVITFNYRLNVFGFLSLGSSHVPGNNGLRDIVTLLRWVRANARAFGGDPGAVTLAGQSAGAAAAHLVALSPQAKGLLHRAILMSGTALSSFFTTTPAYAQTVARMFLAAVGVTATDPEEVHQRLVDMPLEKIMAANRNLQDQFGLTVFFPVVESPHAGVEMVLDRDPERLISEGRGDDIPLLVGFTTNECEIFRPRFRQVDILKKLEANPLLVLSPTTVFSSPADVSLVLAKKAFRRYFDTVPTEDEYIQQCSDSFFAYPALKLARYRLEAGGQRAAPMFLYEFGYQPERSVLKEALGLEYTGAAHIEDLTFLFNVSSVPMPCSCRDSDVRSLMSKFFSNFMRYSDPVGDDKEGADWPPVQSDIRYEWIASPTPRSVTLTLREKDLLTFFDSIQGAS